MEERKEQEEKLSELKEALKDAGLDTTPLDDTPHFDPLDTCKGAGSCLQCRSGGA